MPLPFIVGLIAGVAAVTALRSERARAAMNETGARLRTAVDDAESGARAAVQAGLGVFRRAPGEATAAPAAPADPAPAAAPEAPVESAPAAAVPEQPVAAKPARTRKRAGQAAPVPDLEPAAAKPRRRRSPAKPQSETTEE